MQYGDDDLTGDQSSLENKSLKMVKVNAMLVFAVIVGEQDTGKAVNVVLCLLSLWESKTQVKSGKCSVVFAVIVGEQDTGKKR